MNRSIALEINESLEKAGKLIVSAASMARHGQDHPLADILMELANRVLTKRINPGQFYVAPGAEER
jgi:hypothetical protein